VDPLKQFPLLSALVSGVAGSGPESRELPLTISWASGPRATGSAIARVLV